MNKKQRISVWQMVFTLSVSRMFLIFTDTPIYRTHVESTALIWGNLLSIVLLFLLLTPLFILFQDQNCEHDFLRITSQQSKLFGYIIGWILFGGILLNAISTLVHFQFFMENTIFPSIKTPIILIILFAGAIYAVHLGLEALVRTSSIVFVFMIALILLLLVFCQDMIDFNHIKPIFNQPFLSIIQVALFDTGRTIEIVALILLLPHISNSFRSSIVKFLFISGSCALFISTLTVLILGDYLYQELFPVFTISSLVDFVTIRRLEGGYMMLWSVMGLLKLTLYLIVAKQLLERLLPLKFKKLSHLIVGTITLIGALILSSTVEMIEFVYTVLENSWIAIFFIFLLPLLVLLFQKRTSKKDQFSSVSAESLSINKP